MRRPWPHLFAREPSTADSFHRKLRTAVRIGEGIGQWWRWAAVVVVGRGRLDAQAGPTLPHPLSPGRAQRLVNSAAEQGLVGIGLRLVGSSVGAVCGIFIGCGASLALAAIVAHSGGAANTSNLAAPPRCQGLSALVGGGLGLIAGARMGDQVGLLLGQVARLGLGTVPAVAIEGSARLSLRGVEQLMRLYQWLRAKPVDLQPAHLPAC